LVFYDTGVQRLDRISSGARASQSRIVYAPTCLWTMSCQTQQYVFNITSYALILCLYPYYVGSEETWSHHRVRAS